MSGARGVLINITGGNDLTLFELDEAANRIRDEVETEANIIVGSTMDPEMEGSIRVSVVATGIDYNVFEERENETENRHNREFRKVSDRKTDIEANQPMANGGNRKIAASSYYNRDKLVSNGNGTTEDSTLESNADHMLKSNRGSVSEEARERLLAAVQKTPEPGQFKRPSLRQENEDLQKPSGGAFNNLLQRMTGVKDKSNEEKYNFLMKKRGNVPDGESTFKPKDTNCNSADTDRLEVPAFLRRQAN